MKLASVLATLLLFGSVSFANTEQNMEDQTIKKTHNPITGSDKVKKKTKQRVKTADGSTMKADVTETETTTSKGKKTKTIDVDAKSVDQPE